VKVDELLGRRVSMRPLALLRIAAGVIALVHLRPFLSDALDGQIYRDTFYEPYTSWYPELPRGAYAALLCIGAGSAMLMALGLLTRVTTVVTLGVVAYNVFLSKTHVHNNRAFLLIVLSTLAVAPCGRELSLDAWLRRRRGLKPRSTVAPAWPLWLLRAEATIVYGASGISKLVDADWFGGTVTWLRLVNIRDRLESSVLPDWTVSVLTDRWFHTYAAKVIVFTELFIAAGLWLRATRYAAVAVALCFHVAIQLSASVEVFSYLAIATLVIWLPSPLSSARLRLLWSRPQSTAPP
jgi:hypothetical protein